MAKTKDKGRAARIEEYRKVSLEVDELESGGKVKEGVVILKEWQSKAKENGDRDYKLFFDAEIHHYAEDNSRSIELLQEAFLWTEENNFESDFFLLRSQGLYFANKGELDEAIKWFDKAIAIKPDDHRVLRQKGASFGNKGEFDEAIKWFDKTLAINPDDHVALRSKGVSLSEKGEFDEAIKWFDKAIAIKSDDYSTLREKGLLLSKKGEEDEAIKWYDKALAIKPDDHNAIRNKSVTEYNRGEKERAFVLLCDAIRISPKDYRDDFVFFCGSLGKDADKEWERLFGSVSKLTETVSADEPKAEISELKGFIEMFRSTYSDQAEKFLKLQDDEESNRKDFLLPATLIVKKDSLLLTLRRWNSYTPAIPTGDNERCIGGGYFLRHGGMGIVVDPGYHFIENFHQAGGRVFDIDAIVLTHAHNDHTIEFETLITLVHEYNENIDELKKDEKYKDSKLEKKKIDVYMNNGSFMKFSGLLNLRKNDSIRHIYTLNAGNTYQLDGESIKLEVAAAYHDELVAKEQSVGLIFDLNGGDFNRRVVFTGDTGLLPLDPEKDKPVCLRDYDKEVWKGYQSDKRRPDVLVVHIGSIKSKELDGKFVEPEEACYPNHLGILGTTRVITQCKPKFTIVSEFGEEMNNFRCELVRGLEEVVIKPSLKDGSDGKDYKDLRVVPGDLALMYDLKAEEFYNCVTEKWCSYDCIDFVLDSEEETKQSGIYYFDKANRGEIENEDKKKEKENREYYKVRLAGNLKTRKKVYF